MLLADRLEQALLGARRHAELVGFFCIDLDRFEVINDGLGHAAGDALLQAVALRLKTCVRECDTLARTGGDEFALVANGVENAEEAAAISSRILSSLEAPFEIAGRQLRVTASVGATLYPQDGGDGNSLQQNAAAACTNPNGGRVTDASSFRPAWSKPRGGSWIWNSGWHAPWKKAKSRCITSRACLRSA